MSPVASAAPASRQILGMRVHATNYDDASSRVMAWAGAEDRRRYVCVTTVHTVMEAHDDASLLQIVNNADLVTPDGMPLVWGLRLLGVRDAARVYGPELTPRVLAAAARAGVPVGFYGGKPAVLEKLIAVAREQFPGLRVVYAWSPPFRSMRPEEDIAIVEEINRSGARFMQDHGLEWIFRLASEPRRLWWRYLWHNPRFVVLFTAQLVRQRWTSSSMEEAL